MLIILMKLFLNEVIFRILKQRIKSKWRHSSKYFKNYKIQLITQQKREKFSGIIH